MRGHKHEKRPGVWKLHVNAGADPDTGKRRQVTRTFRGTEREADTELARLVTEVVTGRTAPAAGSLDDLLDRWMAHARLEDSTRDDYASVIRRHIKPRLGERQIHRIRPATLDRLYDDLTAAGLSPARVRRVHTVLRSAFAQAVRWRELAENPAVHATPPAVPRPEIQPPEAAEVRQLLAAARDTDSALFAFLTLDADTGARRGEVCGVRWRDLDLERREVVIARAVSTPSGKARTGKRTGMVKVKETKERNVRRVSISPLTVAALTTWRANSAEAALAWGVPLDGDTFVFHRERHPDIPWRPDVVGHRFARLRDRAGLPGVTLHKLRHYVGTQLIAAGVDVVTVAGRLGHKRPSTTSDMYAAWRPSNDRDAADLLSRLLEG